MAQVVVNLKVFNRSYKIKVDAQEEALVRKKAEDINTKIENFQSKYRGRDIQDYMAMAMIANMTETKKESQTVDFTDVINEIKSIEKLMIAHDQ